MAQKMAVILLVITLVTGIFWFFEKFKKKIYTTTNKKNKQPFKKKQTSQITYKYSQTIASFFPVFLIIFIIRSFIYEPFQIPSGSMMPTLLIGDFILVEKFSYGIKDPIFNLQLKNIGFPKRGDIIVFKYPLNTNLYYIKRIIGLPGDKVSYDYKNKILSINKNSSQKTIITYYNRKINSFRFYPIKSDILKINNNIVNNYLYTSKVSKEQINNISYNILLLNGLKDNVQFYFHQQNNPLGTWIVPKGKYFVMGDNRDNSADSRYWGFVPEENLIGKATKIWFSLEKKENKWPTDIRFKRIGNIK